MWSVLLNWQRNKIQLCPDWVISIPSYFISGQRNTEIYGQGSVSSPLAPPPLVHILGVKWDGMLEVLESGR